MLLNQPNLTKKSKQAKITAVYGENEKQVPQMTSIYVSLFVGDFSVTIKQE